MSNYENKRLSRKPSTNYYPNRMAGGIHSINDVALFLWIHMSLLLAETIDTPHFIVLCLIALCRYCAFHKL